MKRIMLAIFIAGFFVQCADDASDEAVDLGYAFFPLKEGAYYTFKADSIYHDQPVATIPGIHDTSSYYIKEVYDSFFLDAEEKENMRIVRYKKDSLHHDWQITDVWFARLNALNAERVEEDMRFIKLGFPISPFSSWDSNALNTLDPWDSDYDSLYMARTIGELEFENTIRVNQHQFRTEINDELSFEIYAEDVGLVKRFHKELYTRPAYINYPIAANIINGSEYTWEIIDYGEE
jgi:hypothetical protein